MLIIIKKEELELFKVKGKSIKDISLDDLDFSGLFQDTLLLKYHRQHTILISDRGQGNFYNVKILAHLGHQMNEVHSNLNEQELIELLGELVLGELVLDKQIS